MYVLYFLVGPFLWVSSALLSGFVKALDEQLKAWVMCEAN